MKLPDWRRAFCIILVGVLFLTGCSQPQAFVETGEEGDVTPVPTPVVATKPTYTVQLGDVINEIEFTGRVSPVKEAQLSFHTNGYIRKINVQRGEAVKTGQVLAELEVSDLENQLAQAEIALKTSETQLEAAQQVIEDALEEATILLEVEKIKLDQAKYAQETTGGKPQAYNLEIQEQMVDLAQLRVDRLERGVDPLLKLAVDSARLTIQRLEGQFANTQIVAPWDGIITSINIFNEGQAVAAYSPAIVIGDVSTLEVSADLYGGTSVSQLSPGMTVTIEPNDRPGTTQTTGVIRYVPSGAAGEQDKTTRISLDIPAADAGFTLSDLVRVKVVIESKNSVLWLPPQAIRSFEGRRFVVMQDSQGLRRVDISIGVEGNERVEIMSGLTEGQVVQAP